MEGQPWYELESIHSKRLIQLNLAPSSIEALPETTHKWNSLINLLSPHTAYPPPILHNSDNYTHSKSSKIAVKSSKKLYASNLKNNSSTQYQTHLQPHHPPHVGHVTAESMWIMGLRQQIMTVILEDFLFVVPGGSAEVMSFIKELKKSD